MDVNLYVESNNGDFTLRADGTVITDTTLTKSGMAADAKATGDAITAEETARINAVTGEATARANADADLQTQIDQIITPGGAPSEAEITNARIGADGTVYTTLGEAIRTQIDDINEDFPPYFPSFLTRKLLAQPKTELISLVSPGATNARSLILDHNRVVQTVTASNPTGSTYYSFLISKTPRYVGSNISNITGNLTADDFVSIGLQVDYRNLYLKISANTNTAELGTLSAQNSGYLYICTRDPDTGTIKYMSFSPNSSLGVDRPTRYITNLLTALPEIKANKNIAIIVQSRYPKTAFDFEIELDYGYLELNRADTDIIATNELTGSASKAYSIGDYFTMNDKLYKATQAIASSGAITPGTNCSNTSIMTEFNTEKTFLETSVDAVRFQLYMLFEQAKAEKAIGSINYSTGVDITSSTRIRTATYIDGNAYKIYSNTSNFQLMLYVYDRNSTFLGVWSGSGLVKGTSYWKTEIYLNDVREALKTTYPNLLFKFIGRYSNDASVSTADYSNIVIDVPKTEDILASVGLYSNWAVCGASFDCGYYYSQSQSEIVTNRTKSWPQILARNVGNTCTDYTKGGRTAKTFVESTDSYSLTQALTDTPKEMYVMTFGGNDAGSFDLSYQLGSMEDITDYQSYTEYPGTFYGYYGKIIEQLQAHAPNAHFIITTPSSPRYTANQSLVDTAVSELSNYYGIPMIVWESDYFMKSELFTDHLVSSHPSPVLYSGMAMAFERLYGKCVKQYINYFNAYT